MAGCIIDGYIVLHVALMTKMRPFYAVCASHPDCFPRKSRILLRMRDILGIVPSGARRHAARAAQMESVRKSCQQAIKGLSVPAFSR